MDIETYALLKKKIESGDDKNDAIITVLADIFENQVEGFTPLYKTISGSIVTFDTRDLD